ncbi:DUF4357 domain-containing protein [Bacillus sp. RO3]|nr:DUF4357 domain-containing protein [Bacillus sp. RO3]
MIHAHFDTINNSGSSHLGYRAKYGIEHLAARGANALGTPVSNGFKVFKGSLFAGSVSDSYQQGYVDLRKKLIDQGMFITKDGGELCLVDDYIFSSASTAAALVMGRSANGLAEWKTASGELLRDNG